MTWGGPAVLPGPGFVTFFVWPRDLGLPYLIDGFIRIKPLDLCTERVCQHLKLEYKDSQTVFEFMHFQEIKLHLRWMQKRATELEVGRPQKNLGHQLIAAKSRKAGVKGRCFCGISAHIALLCCLKLECFTYKVLLVLTNFIFCPRLLKFVRKAVSLLHQLLSIAREAMAPCEFDVSPHQLIATPREKHQR